MDAKKCDLTGVYWTVTAAETEREFVLFRRLEDGSFQELDVHPTIMNKVDTAINTGKGRLTNHNTMKKVKAAEPKKKPAKIAKKNVEDLAKSDGDNRRATWNKEALELNKKVGILTDELQRQNPELSRREARKQARKKLTGRAPYRRKGEEERAEKQQAKMDAWKKETEPDPDNQAFKCTFCKRNPVTSEGDLCPQCEQNFEEANRLEGQAGGAEQ